MAGLAGLAGNDYADVCVAWLIVIVRMVRPALVAIRGWCSGASGGRCGLALVVWYLQASKNGGTQRKAGTIKCGVQRTRAVQYNRTSKTMYLHSPRIGQ